MAKSNGKSKSRSPSGMTSKKCNYNGNSNSNYNSNSSYNSNSNYNGNGNYNSNSSIGNGISNSKATALRQAMAAVTSCWASVWICLRCVAPLKDSA